MAVQHNLREDTKPGASDNCITTTKSSVSYSISDTSDQSSNELNLSGRRLKSLPNDVFSCNYLISLNISDNGLHDLPEHIGNLNNLLHLDLSNNELQNLPKALSRLIHLKYLNLSHNKFVCVPFVIYHSLQFVRVLNLSHNAIPNFTDHPHCISHLVQLNLSHNNLDSIPKWVFDPKCKIDLLDLSCNPLTKVDRNFMSGCMAAPYKSSVTVLSLQNCKISFDDLNFVMHMTQLKKLNLGNDLSETGFNCVKHINMEILKNCTQLDSVHLSNVGLPLLPKNFDLLKNINHLDLSNNHLTWLPDDFCNLPLLRVCRLNSNQIHFLPEEFGKLTNLRELYLSHNNLSRIPESCRFLKDLEILDLYSNKLQSICLEIINMESLKGIDLERNSIDLFTLSNQDDEGFRRFNSRYSGLRLSLRRMTQHGEDRWDEQNPVENQTNSQETDALSVVSSDELIPYEPGTLCNITDEGYSENWDDDNCNGGPASGGIDDDDAFDPNDDPPLTMVTRRNRTEEFRGNFCPGDYHAKSLSGLFVKKDRDDCVEGQFDLD